MEQDGRRHFSIVSSLASLFSQGLCTIHLKAKSSVRRLLIDAHLGAYNTCVTLLKSCDDIWEPLSWRGGSPEVGKGDCCPQDYCHDLRGSASCQSRAAKPLSSPSVQCFSHQNSFGASHKGMRSPAACLIKRGHLL